MGIKNFKTTTFKFKNDLIKAEVFSEENIPDHIDFDKQLEPVAIVANVMHDKVAGLINKPDAVELEFCLKFGVESGIIVAKGSAEISATVTLKWGKQG
jgi:hypothetical protein